MPRRTDIIGVIDATGANFATGAITVTDVAVAIPATPLPNRKAITIYNTSQVDTVYIGNSGVTSATGYPIPASSGLPMDLGSGGLLYGICETGKSVATRYFEVDNA